MEVLHPRCAGIDVSKREAKVCVRIQGSGGRPTSTEVTTWGATTNQILALREFLIGERVQAVYLESTGVYWKPFYYLLEDAFEMVLVNAHESKTVPGRKTDVVDSAWLAELGAHGLVHRSFVPPPTIRQLRDLTRLRSSVVRDRNKELMRLERMLEDAQIKLSSVVSDLNGLTARAILAALHRGETDPETLADLAGSRLKATHAQLVEALTGQFSPHHGFLLGMHLKRIDAATADIAELDAALEQAMTPFQTACDLICSIPGMSRAAAWVFIAETGGDMSAVPTAQHLCSWAGVAPGMRESAGKAKPASTGHGNTALKAVLGTAAMCAARSNTTFFGARYRRLVGRRGKKRALVAVQRSLLTAAWHVLTTGAFYQDPGPDYYKNRLTERRIRQAIHDLTRLGYQILPAAS